MDFKLCGTENGITGFQLDLKLPGVQPQDHGRSDSSRQRRARAKILAHDGRSARQAARGVEQVRAAHRDDEDQSREDRRLIGPGGKTIKGIVAETGAEINIEDDGTVHIYATSGHESMARAKEIIGGMTEEIEIGKIYHGRVVSIKEFGAFVEVFPGKDGLVHITELADFRVKRTEDIVKIGERSGSSASASTKRAA